MAGTVWIDGDVILYRVGFATQRTIYMLDVEGEYSCSPYFITRSKAAVNKLLKKTPHLLVTTFDYVEESIQAIHTAKLMIQSIVQGSGCSNFKVVLSGSSNFRDKVATIKPYKGNRASSIKPVHHATVKEWLLEKPYTVVSEDEEADDVLSRACIAGDTIATTDKDLDNSPGDHYNFVKKEKYYVSEEEAMRNFYTQMLTGDTADNIPGISGIGPKKAEKALDGCTVAHQYEEAMVPFYHKAYGGRWYEAMTEVGQLLWMRREEDEMWEPTI